MADANITHVITLPNDAWGLALLIAFLGGFLGGVGAALQTELDNPQRSPASIFASRSSAILFFEHLVGRGFVGGVAGMASLFILLLSPITASFGAGAFWAFLAGTSTIFGIFAKRVLPAIENSLWERFGLMHQEIERVQIAVASNSGLDRAERALDDAMSDWAVKSDIKKQTEIVEEYMARMPRTRRPVFRYARVQFEKLKDRNAAIVAFDKFISFLEKNPPSDKDLDYNRDLSDALYNRACYYANRPGRETVLDRDFSPTDSDILAVITNAKYSFSLNPENKNDAKEDLYFDWMRKNSKEFSSLLD